MNAGPNKEFRLPSVVMMDLREETDDLLQVGREYTQAKRDLAYAMLEWERKRALVLVTVTASNAELREAMTLNEIDAEDPEIYARVVVGKAKAEALDKRARIHQARIDALRSELAYLKTEWEHAT